MGVFSRRKREAVELDHGPVSQPSLWERFDATERERRIDEFIAAEVDKQRREWLKLPSIAKRATTCQRCGQGKGRHHVSTVAGVSAEYEVCVREADGEVSLFRGLFFPLMFSRVSEPGPIRLFRLTRPAHLNVACECGNMLGSYRPLDAD